MFLRGRQSPAHIDIIMNRLNFGGLQLISHSVGTNHITLSLGDKKNLSEKIKRIDKMQAVEYYIIWTFPQQEISDAIEEHDYFKAFALCSSMYHSLGKGILFKHINKNNLPINPEKIKGLQVGGVIKRLFDYNLIDKNLKSDMMIINNIRHDFIHYNLSQVIKKEQLQHIYENIDKISTSIGALQKIYDSL